ncbi:MAG: hypothetical protein NC541_04895 [bacterium]|nr:hypothetical protein [bacterium]
MKTSMEMKYEYAYNAWKANRCFNDETAESLLECRERTTGSEIDKAASRYPLDFLEYADKRMGDVSIL